MAPVRTTDPGTGPSNTDQDAGASEAHPAAEDPTAAGDEIELIELEEVTDDGKETRDMQLALLLILTMVITEMIVIRHFAPRRRAVSDEEE